MGNEVILKEIDDLILNYQLELEVYHKIRTYFNNISSSRLRELSRNSCYILFNSKGECINQCSLVPLNLSYEVNLEKEYMISMVVKDIMDIHSSIIKLRRSKVALNKKIKKR